MQNLPIDRLDRLSNRYAGRAILGLLIGLFAISPAPVLAQGGTQQLYLPLLLFPPTVSNVIFAASNDCTEDNFTEPVESTATYSKGIKQLTYAIRVNGGVDSTYQFEWLSGGSVIDGLGFSGTVGQPSELLDDTIYFGAVGTDGCQNELPTGQLAVRFYLNDALVREGVVTIQ